MKSSASSPVMPMDWNSPKPYPGSMVPSILFSVKVLAVISESPLWMANDCKVSGLHFIGLSRSNKIICLLTVRALNLDWWYLWVWIYNLPLPASIFEDISAPPLTVKELGYLLGWNCSKYIGYCNQNASNSKSKEPLGSATHQLNAPAGTWPPRKCYHSLFQRRWRHRY